METELATLNNLNSLNSVTEQLSITAIGALLVAVVALFVRMYVHYSRIRYEKKLTLKLKLEDYFVSLVACRTEALELVYREIYDSAQKDIEPLQKRDVLSVHRCAVYANLFFPDLVEKTDLLQTSYYTFSTFVGVSADSGKLDKSVLQCEHHQTFLDNYERCKTAAIELSKSFD